MSPLAQWLIDNLVQILLILGGGVFALIKLDSFQRGAVANLAKLKSDFESHLKAGSPAGTCPVHSEVLGDIRTSIEEIKATLKTLDNRIYQLIRDRNPREEP